MSSPTSPLFANSMLDDLGSVYLNLLKSKYKCSPLFYYRYVDGIISCIHKDHIELIIKWLDDESSSFNSYNSHLRLTHELQNSNKINFLDITLKVENNKTVNNWYQKPICSDRLTNFQTILLNKILIFYNFVERAILFSHQTFHKDNLLKVKKLKF